MGNYPKALDHYLSAVDIFEIIDEPVVAKCYNNIGEIYKKNKEYKKALEYLNKARETLEAVFGTDDALLTYINIAEVYVQQSKLDTAEMYYNKVLNGVKLGSTRKTAYAKMGLGLIASKRGELNKAEKFYLEALRLRREDQDNRGIVDTYIAMGELLKQLNVYDSANYYFNEAISLALNIEAKDLLLEFYMGKITVDSLNNDYKSAFRNFLKYSTIKDSTFNTKKSQQLARLQTAYETEILKKENEANQIKVKQQTTLIISIIIVVILLLSIVIALYKQRKVQKLANRLLQEKNEEIEQQSEEMAQLNDNLKSLNENLENKVRKRTEKLTEQNEVLSHYAYINAHELRAPVANILGLVNLLDKTELNSREKDLLAHLKIASARLDLVIQDMRKKLEEAEDREDLSKLD